MARDRRAERADRAYQTVGRRARAHATRRWAQTGLRRSGLVVEPRLVVHTTHPTYGYRIRAGRRAVVWAPEFLKFPAWARQADLMFAEAAAWSRPIRFVGGVGGHADVLTVAAAARRAGVKRLVFAHIGRPMLRALAEGRTAPFGSFAADGQVFVLAHR